MNLSAITHSNFEEKALENFYFQSENVEVYRKYLDYIKVKPQNVKSLKEIPFLPISFFKTHQVLAKGETAELTFTSSGTTGSSTSKHYVSDLKLYEQSFVTGFERVYGKLSDYCVLALLPSYLERSGSSLIYMCQHLIEASNHPLSGFYLNDYNKLIEHILYLESQQQKTWLIGVTYALLDLIERQSFNLKYTTILETGGMKGQRQEMIKEALYEKLHQGFGVEHIHSEYGMTELLSQAYSQDNANYVCPPWMSVLIRDPNDPFSYQQQGQSGGINVIDLANINSCSFIATQDLGRQNKDGSFSILGRFDNSDIRGCNLLI